MKCIASASSHVRDDAIAMKTFSSSTQSPAAAAADGSVTQTHHGDGGRTAVAAVKVATGKTID